MAVVYDEGRSAEFTREGVIVTRRLRVTPWNEHPYVCDLLLGGARVIGGALLIIPPARDPLLPWCRCTKVAVEGLGAYTGTAASGLNNIIIKASYGEGARLVVTYQTGQNTMDPRDGDIEDPPGAPSLPTGGGYEPTAQQEIDLAEESYDFSVRALTSDNHSLAIHAADNDVDAPYGMVDGFATKYVPRIDFQLVRHYCVRPPWTAIIQQLGCVNKSTMNVGRRRVWYKGMVRFDGLQSVRKQTSFGVGYFRLTFKFAIMPLYDLITEGDKDYVGWQRAYLWRDIVPGDGLAGKWGWAKQHPSKRPLYPWDEDQPTQTLKGVVVRGFNLLFHPRAT